MPSPSSGYFNATTPAAPNRHKVTIDLKYMILRTVGGIFSREFRSTSSQISNT